MNKKILPIALVAKLYTTGTFVPSEYPRIEVVLKRSNNIIYNDKIFFHATLPINLFNRVENECTKLLKYQIANGIVNDYNLVFPYDDLKQSWLNSFGIDRKNRRKVSKTRWYKRYTKTGPENYFVFKYKFDKATPPYCEKIIQTICDNMTENLNRVIDIVKNPISLTRSCYRVLDKKHLLTSYSAIDSSTAHALDVIKTTKIDAIDYM